MEYFAKKCVECGKKVFGKRTNGLCQECYDNQQDKKEQRDINNTSFPEKVITTWNTKPSFLDKKNNYMYFRIPETQRYFFDPEKIYQIIIKEV